MTFVLDILYALAALAYLPFVLYAMIAKGKYRSGWSERFGGVPQRDPARRCVWLHAVSLGEVNATRTLVAELQKRFPDADIVISATTQTGADAAKRLYPALISVRYPLDFSFIVRRTLNRIRPSMILLMELEVWPNLLSIARKRGIPVCIVNGRVTEERSMKRFRLPLIRSAARWMFSRIAWVAAQDDVYAGRFRELGAQDVFNAGTMKFDTALSDGFDPNGGAPSSLQAGAARLAAAMSIRTDAPLIVAGSTGPGEEEILLSAFAILRKSNPFLQLAIIPRKPERFDEVASLIESHGYACIRRSRRPDGIPGDSAPFVAVFLGDSMGELRMFYALSQIVFVGRTLVPMGGSDPMEVAALAKPMLVGPHMENFADAAEKLARAGAMVTVANAAALADAATRWLSDPASAASAGLAGYETVRANTGATQRTADRVAQTLAALTTPTQRT